MHELVFACAAPEPNPEAIARLAARADWRAETHFAERHGLAPLLYWHVKHTCPEAAPADVLAALEECFHANIVAQLHLAFLLSGTLRALASAGIPSMAYKGPALAMLAYGQLGLRKFGDIDALVPEEHAQRAVELAETFGWRALRMRAERAAASIEVTFEGPKGSLLDLHWRLTPKYFPAFDPPGLWDRLDTVMLPAGPARTLPVRDHLVYAAIDHGRDCWESLGDVADYARVLHRQPVDWEAVFGLARRLRVVRMLRLAVYLATHLLGAPAPTSVIGECSADAAVVRSGMQIAERLFEENLPGREHTVRGALLHLRLLDTARQRAGYVFRRVFHPTPHDVLAVRLPARLAPLYYGVRPIRLLLRAFGVTGR